jgi:putative acetyltransferase
VDIREERPADEAAVRHVVLAAFRRSVVVDLVEGLRGNARNPDSLSLVAVDDDRVVGHVMFTRSLLDAPRRLVDVQVLSPLSVHPERQGSGIGSALVRNGLAVLAERGVPLVFLEGSPHYYSRFGFRAGADLGFRKPSLRIPDAAFQVFPLPAYEPWMTGTLVYSEIFWQYDVVGLRDDD